METKEQKLITVHAKDLEGSIQIDAKTGIVQTPVDLRPEWADGLVCALLHERGTFYFGSENSKPRLDRDSEKGKAIAAADPIDFADLGWIAFTQEGQQVEIEASAEFRMDVIAEAFMIDRADADSLAGYEMAVAQDTTRTVGEVDTLTSMQEAGFGSVEEQEQTATSH